MTPQSVAAVLRRVRKEKDMTQFMLAELASVSKNTVIHFEKGNHDTGFKSVCHIARALGYDLILVRRKQ